MFQLIIELLPHVGPGLSEGVGIGMSSVLWGLAAARVYNEEFLDHVCQLIVNECDNYGLQVSPHSLAFRLPESSHVMSSLNAVCGLMHSPSAERYIKAAPATLK